MLGLAGAGEGVDRARGEIDDADAMIGDIGDVEMPLLGIERETVGLGKPGARRRPAIAGIGRLAGAGQGRDGPIAGVDAADAAIEAVGDKDVAGPVDCDAIGLVERGPRRRSAIAGVAGLAIAGDCRDDAAPGIDAADAVVEGVGETEIPGLIEGNIERAVQQSRLGRAAIAGKALRAGPDRRCDHIIRHLRGSVRGAAWLLVVLFRGQPSTVPAPPPPTQMF